MTELVILHLKLLILATSVTRSLCSIEGASYLSHGGILDPKFRLHRRLKGGEDPCNPLYWYPRQVPDYCNFHVATDPPAPGPPKPYPPIDPIPPSVAIQVPVMPPIPYPVPPPSLVLPLQSAVNALPYPMPVVPDAGPSAMDPFYTDPTGFVPGLSGLSKDGGINIMPFSDIYSDMIEDRKKKMIRSRLRDLLDEYDSNFSRRRNSKIRHITKVYARSKYGLD